MQFRRYLDAYLSLFANDSMLYATRERPLSLFLIPLDDTMNIIRSAESVILKEPNLLKLHSPIVVVGDLHGQFLDLIRIFQKNGIPPGKKFLFLGDLVDRGDFSFDILIFLFLLKILHPESIYFIRGNHEFNSLASTMGFFNEILDKYGEPSIYNAFINVFNYFPLGALVNEKILCIHGGLGPNFTSISQIPLVYRPLCEFGKCDVADDILWSDPSNDVDTYELNKRGAGWTFGKTIVDKFCDENNIDMIIRGHECVMNGYENFFDGKLLTVFSASNSVGSVGNDAAVVEIKNPPLNKIDINPENPNTNGIEQCTYVLMVKQYPPLPYLTREQVFYTSKLRLSPVPSQLPVFSKPHDPSMGPLNLRRYQQPHQPVVPHPPISTNTSNPRKLSRTNFHAHSNKDIALRTKMCQDSQQIRSVSNSAKNLPTWSIPSDLIPERSILFGNTPDTQENDQKLPMLKGGGNKQQNRHSLNFKSKKFNTGSIINDDNSNKKPEIVNPYISSNSSEVKVPSILAEENVEPTRVKGSHRHSESKSKKKKPNVTPLNNIPPHLPNRASGSSASIQLPNNAIYSVRRPVSNRKRKRADELL